jgi:hypothetical protein
MQQEAAGAAKGKFHGRDHTDDRVGAGVDAQIFCPEQRAMWLYASLGEKVFGVCLPSI